MSQYGACRQSRLHFRRAAGIGIRCRDGLQPARSFLRGVGALIESRPDRPFPRHSTARPGPAVSKSHLRNLWPAEPSRYPAARIRLKPYQKIGILRFLVLVGDRTEREGGCGLRKSSASLARIASGRILGKHTKVIGAPLGPTALSSPFP